MVTTKPKDVRLNLVSADTEFVRLELSDHEGEPIDLGGYMIRVVLKKASDAVAALTKSTVDGGIEILDQTTDKGAARVHILPLESDPLEKNYAWQVRVWDPAGSTRIPVGGTAKVAVNIV